MSEHTYGGCGVEGCTDCLPQFDEDNRELEPRFEGHGTTADAALADLDAQRKAYASAVARFEAMTDQELADVQASDALDGAELEALTAELAARETVSIRSGHAADRFLVVITEQDPYAFAVETLADAAAALNRETPVWGGFVLERTEDGSSFRSADVYLDDDSGTYVVGEG